jgi:protein-S-isoprenylcysteine O-methyltransferase Ste14
MAIYIILPNVLIFIWVVYEVWLVARDRTSGKGTTAKDNGTRLFNFLSIGVGLTAAGIIDGYREIFLSAVKNNGMFIAGLGVIVLGLLLRMWAIAVLGKSFRTTVETHEGQTVVQSGPYRLIRHPSYSGLLLICLGYGLSMTNWLSIVAATVFPLVALLYRINVEEKVLVASLGPEYEEYRKRTKRLIPWIW